MTHSTHPQMTHSTHSQHLPFTDGHYKSILSFFLSSIKREGLFDFIFPTIKWGKTHRQHFPKMLKCHCKNASASLFFEIRRPLIYSTPLSLIYPTPLSVCLLLAFFTFSSFSLPREKGFSPFSLSLPSLLSLYPQPGQCASEHGSVKYDLLFLDVPTFAPLLLSSPLLSFSLLSLLLSHTLLYSILPSRLLSLLPPSFFSSLLPSSSLSVYCEVQKILREILGQGNEKIPLTPSVHTLLPRLFH